MTTKVTFLNSQRDDSNSKGDFVLKKQFKTFTKIDLRFGMTNSINKHLRLKIPYINNTNFQPYMIINCKLAKPNMCHNYISN